MLAEDGRREELSWTERKLAYGFSVSSLSPQGCRVSLVSFKERPIRVERAGTRFRALIAVQGRSAVLDRIFVQASEGSVFPTVEHLDVFATGLDGTPLRERLART